ncbi:hypothetical protein DBT46_002505 [Aerococcus mictus]
MKIIIKKWGIYMKKALLFLTSLALLAGCQSNDQNAEADQSNSATTSVQEKQNDTDLKDVGNAPLENVGEFTTRNGAKATLLAIHKPEGQQDIAENISVSVNAVKIVELSDIEKDSLYDVTGYQNGDKIIQVNYTFDNQTDSQIDNIGMPKIVTSSGEQISPTNLIGDHTALPKAKVDTGFFEKIKDTDISGITLNWELFINEPEFQKLPSNPLEINF